MCGAAGGESPESCRTSAVTDRDPGLSGNGGGLLGRDGVDAETADALTTLGSRDGGRPRPFLLSERGFLVGDVLLAGDDESDRSSVFQLSTFRDLSTSEKAEVRGLACGSSGKRAACAAAIAGGMATPARAGFTRRALSGGPDG